MRRAALVLSLALLAGCAQEEDPKAELQERLNAAVAAANAGDAAGLRQDVATFVQLVDQQRRAGELDPQEAQRLIALARRVEARAQLLDRVEETPTPTPDRPTPTPTPSPSPPPPPPSPTPDEPEETEEPDEQPSESAPVDPLPTLTPAAKEEPTASPRA